MKITSIAFVVIFFFFILNYFFIKNITTKRFLLRFECGFDSILWEPSKLRVHFFKIGIIFILFDLELIFLLFLIKNFPEIKTIIFIHVFILVTFFVENKNNLFKWSF